jgi:oligopeptide transport system substrate-binding protein
MASRLRLLALLSLTVLLSGANAPALAGGTLRRASGVEPETLDMQKTAGIPERLIALDLFEGLTAYGADGSVGPGIATSWDVSADGRSWVFHLRPGAQWSNGDPLTAEDFLYSLRRLVDPATASPNASAMAMIVGAEEILAGKETDLTRLGVRAADPLTLVIDLREPAPFLPALLATVGLPVNRKAIEAHGAQWTKPDNIVTDGAFVMTEWTPQAQIVLRRNPLYHAADQVRLDEVRWIVVEDDSTALKCFRDGEVDISTLQAATIPVARNDFAAELRRAPTLSVDYLVFNLRAAPFASNLKLRQALALATDRATLNGKIVDPAAYRSTASLIPPFDTDYRPQVPDYAAVADSERLAAARKLMTEAGYPPGTPLKLTVLYSTSRTTKKRLLSIAAMWKQALGVELKLQNREWLDWLAALRRHDFQLAWSEITGDIPDASDILGAYQSKAGELNDAGYDDPAYDRLLDDAAAEADPRRRTLLLEQAERRLLEAAPLIPLDNPVAWTLVSRRVVGWRDNVSGMHPSRYLDLKPGP